MDRNGIRIAVIMASSGVDAIGMEDRRRYLQDAASVGTEIVMVPNPDAPPAIVDAYEGHLAALHVSLRAEEVERDGIDAAVIWCGDDPGLESARERVAIPVIGPSDASLSIARQLGDTFAVVSSAGSDAHIHRRVRNAGLSPLLAGVYRVDIPVLGIRDNLGVTKAAMAEAIAAGQAAGADSFVVGCMAMYGLARELTAELGVPVIDGGEAAVLTAELLVKMGLAHAKTAFPCPPGVPNRALV